MNSLNQKSLDDMLENIDNISYKDLYKLGK